MIGHTLRKISHTVPFLLLTISPFANGQGIYAGSMKSLIGKTYVDTKSLTELKAFGYHEAGLMSDINDPESLTVDHFQKGTTAVVFFSIKEDQNAEKYTIVDVMEIKYPEG